MPAMISSIFPVAESSGGGYRPDQVYLVDDTITVAWDDEKMREIIVEYDMPKGAYGFAQECNNSITISDKGGFDERFILLHEIMHHIMYRFGNGLDDEATEAICDVMTRGVLNFIRNNPEVVRYLSESST